eukprot:1180192-Prorocentrum_minimum.AAC.2
MEAKASVSSPTYLVGGREGGDGDGRAVVGTHDALRQQEVAEERGHQQVLFTTVEKPAQSVSGETSASGGHRKAPLRR